MVTITWYDQVILEMFVQQDSRVGIYILLQTLNIQRLYITSPLSFYERFVTFQFLIVIPSSFVNLSWQISFQPTIIPTSFSFLWFNIIKVVFVGFDTRPFDAMNLKTFSSLAFASLMFFCLHNWAGVITVCERCECNSTTLLALSKILN